MNPIKFLHTSLLLAALAFTSSCATKRAVELAVAEADIAMVEPYLNRPEGSQPDGYKEAIKKMDAVITKYPDQTVLVNQLRIRQAMLLTVNGKNALASQRWGTVDPNALKTDRDKAFYRANKALVWAYYRLPTAESLSQAEADPYVTELDQALVPVKEPSVSIYLHTVRALIQLKVASGMNEKLQPDETSLFLKNALKTYVMAFPPKDQDWVKSGAIDGSEVGMSIGELRQRIWLDELVRKYKQKAGKMKLTPSWEPDWVGTLKTE